MAGNYPHTCGSCEKLTLQLEGQTEHQYQHHPEGLQFLFEEFTTLDAIAAAGNDCALCNWLLYPTSMEWLNEERLGDYKLYYIYIPASENGQHAEIREFGFKMKEDPPRWRRRCRFVVYAESDNSIPTVAITPERSIQLACKWLNDCEKHSEHSKCGVDQPLLPNRVIQICKDGNRLRLILRVKPTERARYAALTYSWGGSQGFVTTKENEHERQGDIPLNGLPKTIRDAVRVTSELGICFLWVDSQCILQNDDNDRRDQFLEQATIYSNATITIAASRSESHREGFLNNIIFKLPKLSREGERSLVQLWKLNSPNEQEPLSKRGWAFQEYQLSRRMLFYESYRLRWACYCGFDITENWFSNLPLAEIYKPADNPDGRPGSVNFLAGQTNEEAIRGWYKCVESFSQRDLTQNVDKIPAVTGLAVKYIEVLRKLPFASGIWLHTRFTARPTGELPTALPAGLSAGLLWIMRSPGPWKLPKPAWSWPSSDGPVDTSYISALLTETPGIVVTNFQEYHSPNPGGRVYKTILQRLFARTVGETVTLSGRIHLAELILGTETNYFDTLKVRVGNSQIANLATLLHFDVNLGPNLDAQHVAQGDPWGPTPAELLTADDLGSGEMIPVVLLRLYPAQQNYSITSIIGLILVHKENLVKENIYTRIGVFEFYQTTPFLKKFQGNVDETLQEQRAGDLERLNREFDQSELVEIKLL